MKKLLKIVLLSIFIFVLPIINVNAETGKYKNASINMKNYQNGSSEFYVAPGKKHTFDSRNPIFWVHQYYNDDGYVHAYCLHIAEAANTGDESTCQCCCNSLKKQKLSETVLPSGKSYDYDKQFKLLEELLSNAYYYKGNITKSIYTGESFVGNHEKTIATQILVWEVVEGGRTSFDSYEPNVYNQSNSAYKRLIQPNDKIFIEYKAIIDKIKNNGKPSKDNTVFASTSTYVLPWDGTRYSKNLGNVGAYTDCSTEEPGVSVSGSSGNLIVSSTKVLDKEVKITCKHKVGTTESDYKHYYRFTCIKNCKFQDLIRARLSYTYKATLNVTTTTQKIKIMKVDENGADLPGAAFKLTNTGTNEVLTFDLTSVSSAERVLNQSATYILEETTVPKDRAKIPPATISIDASTGTARLISGGGGLVEIINGDTITIKVKNKKNYVDLIINKVGKAGAKLEGVEFYLWDSTRTKKLKSTIHGEGSGTYTFLLDQNASGVESYITNKNGQIIVKSMTPGIYYFEEYSTGDTGYAVPEGEDAFVKIEIKATNNGITVNNSSTPAITISNAKNEFSFFKVDENGNYLSGGMFKIQTYSKKKERYIDSSIVKVDDPAYTGDTYKIDPTGTIYTFSINDGIATFIEVDSNTKYRIVEIAAPEGYSLSTVNSDRQLVIEVDESGYVKNSTTMVNKKTTVGGEAEAKAELIVNIQTGQTKIRYTIIISVILVIIIVLFKIKKKEK